MDELTQLANALMALDDKLAACMKCGFCQAFCPMYMTTRIEGDLTRGKIALIENLAHRLIEDPEAVNEKLSRCLLCGSCQANCPSGVHTTDIFLEARAIVAAYLGMSAMKKAAFRMLLPNPRLFDTLMRVGAPFQKFVLKKDETPQNTASAPLLKSLLGDRHVPVPAEKPLHRTVGKLNTPKGKSRVKVAFFPGCLGDKVYTNVSEACLKVFDYHEIGVFLSDGYACCGMPALASGDRQGFEKMVMHNVDVLKDQTFDYIVTPCSSCTVAIREYWPRLSQNLPPRYRDAINALSPKAIDVNALLVDVLHVAPKAAAKGQTKVTYHESCHLQKSLGVSKQPRDLIRMNSKYNLVEMAEATRCCGCGGSFTLTHYDLAQKMGQRKRDNVIASGADVVATGCPACMMQLADMLARNHDAVEVKHTIEIYAESLPG